MSTPKVRGFLFRLILMMFVQTALVGVRGAEPDRAAGVRDELERAKQLYRRRQMGEKLTPEEEAFLERMLKERRRRMGQEGPVQDFDWQRVRAILERMRRGEAVPEEDRAYLERVRAMRRIPDKPKTDGIGQPSLPAPGGEDSVGLTPLTELGSGRYKGEDGGLYGGGTNV
ncbi:MAG: hypothetical protein N2255_08980, partial [Kiritimatiellae bacterium]|nr:hypothetical protein [Kiritimatiellia bacterium]